MALPEEAEEKCAAQIQPSVQQPSQARLAQPAERKALNLVVVGSSPTVSVTLFGALAMTVALTRDCAADAYQVSAPVGNPSSFCSRWQSFPSLARRSREDVPQTPLLGFRQCQSPPAPIAPPRCPVALPLKNNHVHHCSEARLAQPAERKALNLVVVGLSPTVGVLADSQLSAVPPHRRCQRPWSRCGPGLGM